MYVEVECVITHNITYMNTVYQLCAIAFPYFFEKQGLEIKKGPQLLKNEGERNTTSILLHSVL